MSRENAARPPPRVARAFLILRIEHATRRQDCDSDRRGFRLRRGDRCALRRGGRDGRRQRRERRIGGARRRRDHGIGRPGVGVRRGRVERRRRPRAGRARAGDVRRPSHRREQCRHDASQPADAGRVGGGVRPHLRGERQEPVPHRAARGPALSTQARRRDHHHRVDGGRAAAAGAHLVQRQQGRGDRHVALDGRGARAGQRPRQRHQPGRRRDGDARTVHGRGHAGDARRSSSPRFRSAGFRCLRTSRRRRSSSPRTRRRS